MKFEERFEVSNPIDHHGPKSIPYKLIRDTLTGNKASCSIKLFPSVYEALKKVYETKEFRFSDYPYPLYMKIQSMWQEDDRVREARKYIKEVFPPTKEFKGRPYINKVRDMRTELAVTSQLMDCSISFAALALYNL
jgi:hypothetical protein